MMLLAIRLLLITALLLSQTALGHGGVVEEEDLCVIKVNYLRGHFKIYQPRIDRHEEYCEDLPNATESVFVMEYLHDGLRQAAVDFRIIQDVTGKGRFARYEDIEAIDDLDSVTVFYQEPTVDPDVLTVMHDFVDEGDYIGIVTANVDGDAQIYRAVFPFEVGFTGMGYWPWFVLLLVAVQIQYLIMSGRIRRWRGRGDRTTGAQAALILLLTVPVVAMDARAAEGGQVWTSERGFFAVSFESTLDPIEINRMHSWVLHVTANGKPVTGAEITVEGGMPEHDHGLPTRPRITAETGPGEYRLEGMRFHMRGAWELSIAIEAAGKTDTVILALVL